MQCNDGVRAAIQSLAGVYIYDYLPTTPILDRLIEKFDEAECRLKYLLNEASSFEVGKGSEVIAILVILSMQDVSQQARQSHALR